MSYNHQCPADGKVYRIQHGYSCTECGEGPVNVLGQPSPNRTDFSAWSRPTLEQFARQVADENLVLRDDLKNALAAWRQAVRESASKTGVHHPNNYTTTRSGWGGAVVVHTCTLCAEEFRSEHAAAFHECPAK